MSEEKKKVDDRPYWQKRRDQKLGTTLKPAEQKKQTKDALTIWFDLQATMAPQNCENCATSLAATINFHPRAHICHIVPKTKEGGCPSVATHPLNRWFGCINCHNAYDQESPEVVETMTVIPICRERLSKFINQIADDEIRRVPEFLLPETTTFESPPVAAVKKIKPVPQSRAAIKKAVVKKSKPVKNGKTEKPARGPGGKFIPKQCPGS